MCRWRAYSGRPIRIEDLLFHAKLSPQSSALRLSNGALEVTPFRPAIGVA
jgi:hypothetical protein